MSTGVSPLPFHGGLPGRPRHHYPSLGSPGGLGQGAHLLGRGPREGGFGGLPLLLLRAVSGGAQQGWRVPGEEKRAGLALRPSLAAEGTAAPQAAVQGTGVRWAPSPATHSMG